MYVNVYIVVRVDL